MKIDNFVLPKNTLGNRFKCGIKFIPERTLNKYLDYILFVVKSGHKGEEVYNLCFKRGNAFNNLVFSQKSLEEYICFLQNVYNSTCSDNLNIEEEFLVKEGQKIVISSLNENYLKLCSVKEGIGASFRVFFVLSKEELGEYLLALNAFCREKKIIKELEKPNKPFLRQKEKESLYLNTIYILLNEALDRKDKKMFEVLSGEIKKLTK
ncbi:hypothetical protein CLLI_21660 [Clostridium liquoris]|uniref:IDEAL domain-containing protein n=1 Tax=Clostridium liquoris TaxID=1289519 RepID=A0A2T0B261_9CLOT|nr:hypothetical protein [Clostridium liquoris]PRR77778.1 hypothetical protein CLLI_21660 [Clostridium liquoris]